MTIILNLLWLVFGGWILALAWLLAAGLMFVSVIGIPWAPAVLNLAWYTAWPYGRDLVDRRHAQGEYDPGVDKLGLTANLIWLVLAGVWLAIGHVILAAFLGLSIIGLPFAIAHLKIAGAALMPVGKAVVDKPMADEVRRREASARLDRKLEGGGDRPAQP
jgi:uncharacterized membrane protein YccF (DUF307 family)